MVRLAGTAPMRWAGIHSTRWLLLSAAVRLPPIEILITLAVILAANVAVGIAVVRGETESDVLRSFVQTLGAVSQVAVDVFLIVLGLAGAVMLLLAGFVLPDLLAERERARHEEPTPRAVDPEPVASDASFVLDTWV